MECKGSGKITGVIQDGKGGYYATCPQCEGRWTVEVRNPENPQLLTTLPKHNIIFAPSNWTPKPSKKE